MISSGFWSLSWYLERSSSGRLVGKLRDLTYSVLYHPQLSLRPRQRSTYLAMLMKKLLPLRHLQLPSPSVAPTEALVGVVPIDPGVEPSVSPTPQVGLGAPTKSPSVAPTTALPAAEPTFSDVPPSYWAYPFIEALAKRDVVRGFADRTFRPNQPVNRAEFAALVESAFENSQQQRSPVDFNDVQPGFWAIPAINRAYSTGFMEGYPGKVFRPGQLIPRVQAIAALSKGLNLTSSGDVPATIQRYQDANQIPDWANDRVAAATAARLVVNHPNLSALEPARETTRAEAAALIYQAMAQAGLVEPIESQYIVNP